MADNRPPWWQFWRHIEVVPYWRRALRLPSVWVAALGSGLITYLSADPFALLHLWQQLPYEAKALISPTAAGVIAALVWLVSFLASRLLRKREREGGDGRRAP